MDMQSRRQYLQRLQEQYQTASKEEKGKLLDEYVRNTRHHRKYVIGRLNDGRLLEDPVKRRKKGRKYGVEVMKPLREMWEIFDYPCGQRLTAVVRVETDRLRKFGEITLSHDVAEKLKSMSSATMDRLLCRAKREVRREKHSMTRPGSLLKKKIAIRLTDWDTRKIGYVEVDLVAHNGVDPFGEYINTLSVTEVATQWWEGEAIMGKGERLTQQGIEETRKRSPFNWLGLDSDNGGEFINHHLKRYCDEAGILFTRSRPSHKNDNAYVEQKNWTHVRKVFGYFRYDTPAELAILNDILHNELRLYKNFFQPVMKLAKKERIGSKVHRKYEEAKTPYQRLIESDQISHNTKEKLKALYETLNPAALKQQLDRKLDALYRVHQAKHPPQKGGKRNKIVKKSIRKGG